MKKFTILILSILLSIVVQGQENDYSFITFLKVHNNPFASGWQYFQLKKELRGKVISYDKSIGSCNSRLTYAAVCMVKSGKDTVRVLLPCLCYLSQIDVGDEIIVEPAKEQYKAFQLPYHKTVTTAGAKTWKLNEFDNEILATTYGTIKSHKAKHCRAGSFHDMPGSFACEWKIVEGPGQISGTVLQFNRELRGCGDVMDASAAIIKTNKDTIRIILCCFGRDLAPGQEVKVQLGKWQNHCPPPQDDNYSREEFSKEREFTRMNEYDKIILKTAFGSIDN